MEDIKMPTVIELSKEETIEKQYRQKQRELRIARTRASVLRKKITEAYEILEDIRFDFLGDTAFREKVVGAKRNLENAMDDFLLSDLFWEKRIERHANMSPEDYDKEMNNDSQPLQSESK